MEIVKTTQMYNSILEFLLNQPTLSEILELAPSQDIQERVTQLLEKNRRDELSQTEYDELDEYLVINHLVTLVKANTLRHHSS